MSGRRLLVQTWACSRCYYSLAGEPPADGVCGACKQQEEAEPRGVALMGYQRRLALEQNTGRRP